MRKSLFFCFIVAAFIFYFSAATAAAQTNDAPKEVQAYVAKQGKKQKVPAAVNTIVKGDLNGDGKEDLAVQYYVQVGFPGNATTIATAVFLKKGNKFVFAAETADKFVPTAVENRKIVGDLFAADDSQEKIGTVKYKLVGRKLVKTK